jgi:hypothetical protein
MKSTFVILALILVMTLANAAVPQQINYLGSLANTSGTALDTTVAMTFKLYTDSTAGSLLWTEPWPSVTVQRGLFNVRLGQLTALTDEILNQAQVWLGIQVGADAEMTPRTRIVSVGYSYRVGTVDGASGGTISSDVIINNRINVGSGNTNTGSFANVHGETNSALGNHATISGGNSNSVNGDYSTVAGGIGNAVTGTADTSTIGGGSRNLTTAVNTTVGGGFNNTAAAPQATVAGGASNYATGFAATIAGGQNDSTTDSYASVGGGHFNTGRGLYSTVAGGSNNKATVEGAFIGGGESNTASGIESSVAGGHNNAATASLSFIGGGENNTASGIASSVAGGHKNEATASHAFVGGGDSCFARGTAATIAGGSFNKANGNYSIVCGGGGALQADSNSASGDFAFIGGGANNTASGDSSVVGGGSGNLALAPSVTIGGGSDNTANAQYATIGGGYTHQATGFAATVAGGYGNWANDQYASVGGGFSQSASGYAATIPGGYNNSASASYAFAAGRNAIANDVGAFVWADSNSTSFQSSAVNQFNVRASGGTRIFSNAAITLGAQLAANATAWTALSDSTKKTDIQRVDTKTVLAKVMQLPISEWRYKDQPISSIRHMGPMAQDFWTLFHLGEDSLGISTLDPDGIALAAIQELARQVQELKTQNQSLQARVQTLEAGKMQSMNADSQKGQEP